jgi:hypothetical protein
MHQLDITVSLATSIGLRNSFFFREVRYLFDTEAGLSIE